ncbi:MAG: WXG100 family type VII secretion target [Kineosporiaceae bacterium]
MSLMDRFLPPPGAPGAVRQGARCWRVTADRLDHITQALRHGSAVLGTSWEGPARSAYDRQSGGFLDAVVQAVGLLRRYADSLDELARGIEQAQDEYHQRIGMVVGNAVLGGLLTAVTATLSDEAAAGAITAEMALVSELATTAAEQAVAVLASLGAQAAALAARWALLAGVMVAADGVSGVIVYGDADPLRHVHWAEDVEFALVGAVAVPMGAALVSGVARSGGAALSTGVAGVATRLAIGGAAMAGANGLVRTALRQGVDPGELVMAALPFGRAGRGRMPGVAPEGAVPRGFADAAEFAAFTAELKSGLAEAGYRDAVPVFQGSAVTGVKYLTGEPFDVGRRSDFDIAIVDPKLFEDARSLGVKTRSGPARTAPLTTAFLRALGLQAMQDSLSARAERKVAFMVYRDLRSALDRAGGIVIR